MELRFQNGDPANWQAAVALLFAREGDDVTANSLAVKICPWITTSPGTRAFKGKKGEIAVLYGPADARVPAIILAGVGSRDSVKIEDIRSAAGSAVQKCRKSGFNSILLPVDAFPDPPGGSPRFVHECVCGAFLGLYRFTSLKTVRDEILPNPEWFAPAQIAETPEITRAARLGENAADATAFARDLDNLPGNLLYPETLALRAVEQAQKYGLKYTVLNENGLNDAGMGCILAVGDGSVHKPRLVTLEYAPAGREEDKPVVLVGKGITFDSGGLCLKPAANMNQMKADMSGAAAVLAVIRALAREKAPRRAIAVLACAENMPDGGAYRPGDVLTSASGETVEVVNTDAEGRLVLCDALAYARNKWEAKAVIDVATLTGACAVALGTKLAGLFCDDEDLAEKILAVGAACGENFWRLPLWQAYEESLKSEIADIRHTASREGGAITAALFLRHFVDKRTPWAHLDIAGVDWNAKGNALCPEGPTGFGARTLLELLRGWE